MSFAKILPKFQMFEFVPTFCVHLRYAEIVLPILQAIFNHLRKIRNTKYPIQRALRLVEAISRDLVNQMLKVLGTRRLMYIGFDEFEKV